MSERDRVWLLGRGSASCAVLPADPSSPLMSILPHEVSVIVSRSSKQPAGPGTEPEWWDSGSAPSGWSTNNALNLFGPYSVPLRAPVVGSSTLKACQVAAIVTRRIVPYARISAPMPLGHACRYRLLIAPSNCSKSRAGSRDNPVREHETHPIPTRMRGAAQVPRKRLKVR